MLASVVLVSLNGARDKGRVAGAATFSSTNYHAFGADAFAIYIFESTPWTSPKINEYMGTPRNLTCSGGTTQTTTDMPYGTGLSLIFSSPNSVCTYTDSSNSTIIGGATSYSVSLWVKPTGPSSTFYLQNYDTNTSTTLSLIDCKNASCTTGGVEFTSDGITNSNQLSAPYPLTANKWYNVTASFSVSSGKATYYIDGKLFETDPYGATDAYSSNVPPGVGRNLINLTANTISIYNLSLYNHSLSQAEATKIYADGAAKLGLAVR
jgi:hypothetical protein